MPHRASNLAVSAPRRHAGSDPLADALLEAGSATGKRSVLLYDHCHERLYRLIVRMVGQQDAADLLQQVFLQVFVKIGQLGRARFDSWVYRLAINECLQFRRRSAAPCDMPAEEPVDPSASHTTRTQQQEMLDRALAQLTPDLRAIFVLREIEGMLPEIRRTGGRARDCGVPIESSDPLGLESDSSTRLEFPGHELRERTDLLVRVS